MKTYTDDNFIWIIDIEKGYCKTIARNTGKHSTAYLPKHKLLELCKQLEEY